MKTAVSIPNPVFTAADKLATKLRVSRSQLYADALEAYLVRYDGAQLTARLNAVLERTPSTLDPALARAQSRAVGREKW
jgi:metal-responsive CopG/Arc/MetJ family transcriptional regulator